MKALQKRKRSCKKTFISWKTILRYIWWGQSVKEEEEKPEGEEGMEYMLEDICHLAPIGEPSHDNL